MRNKATTIFGTLGASLLIVGLCLLLYQPLHLTFIFVQHTVLHGSLWSQGLTVITFGAIIVAVAYFTESGHEAGLK